MCGGVHYITHSVTTMHSLKIELYMRHRQSASHSFADNTSAKMNDILYGGAGMMDVVIKHSVVQKLGCNHAKWIFAHNSFALLAPCWKLNYSLRHELMLHTRIDVCEFHLGFYFTIRLERCLRKVFTALGIAPRFDSKQWARCRYIIFQWVVWVGSYNLLTLTLILKRDIWTAYIAIVS